MKSFLNIPQRSTSSENSLGNLVDFMLDSIIDYSFIVFIFYEPRSKENLLSAYAKRNAHHLYFLNPKFQASSHLLWLYSLVCVDIGQKPQRQVFS